MSGGPRELDGEGRAAPEPRALGVDAAAVPLDDGADDEEAEPRPLEARHEVAGHAVEAPEDALELVVVDADAAVSDAHRHEPLVDGPDFDLDVHALVGILHGV